MTRFLVRKALNLMEEELKFPQEDTSAHHKKLKSKKQSKEIRSAEIIEWKFERQNPYGSYYSDENVDKTEENLSILKELSKLQPKRAAAQKVLDYHLKVQSKRDIEKEVEEPEPESILFPEENLKKKKRKS